MLNFLYHIPGIYMALMIVGTTVFVVFFGYAIVKYFHWLEVDADQRALALTMVSIITTINSLLVAFAAISVWGNYNDADRTVSSEAISASELARDLSVFGSRDADAADLDLRTYLVRVVEAEWPSMQQQQRADPGTELCFTKVFKSVSLLSPMTPRQTVLLSEVLARMNEMVKFRQQRLQGLAVCMPLTLWAVILIVSAMSFVLLYVLPPRPFYICLIGCWACTLGLAFFFIVAVDHPFAGDFSVSSSALQEAIENLTESQVWPAP